MGGGASKSKNLQNGKHMMGASYGAEDQEDDQYNDDMDSQVMQG
jgi:hypothetical protein